MRIGTREVGPGHPCLIVAEIAQAHDGSLGNAHAYIDAVADAGADAVKFQCHLGDDTDQWRVRPTYAQDEDRAAYWRRSGFSAEQWAGLAQHAKERGLTFLASPFSVEAVKLLDPLVEAWKVPSGEITNEALISAVINTGKPMILSSGMSPESEIDAILTRAIFSDVAVLQCRSEYPCPPERVGLSVLAGWRAAQRASRLALCDDHEPAPLGLSDHSGSIWPSVAAVALGASIVEVHVCWSRKQFGFDTSSSVTVEELKQLVEGVRFVEAAMTPVDKDKVAAELSPMRALFMGARA